MSKSVVKKRAQALLAFASELTQVPGLTWVDANNAIWRWNALTGAKVRVL